MRILVPVLCAFVLFPVYLNRESQSKSSRMMPFHLHISNKTTNLLAGTTSINNCIDTNAIQQSRWYADLVKSVETSEYEIKKDNSTSLYSAPNRQQQLRASFNYNSFILQPRIKKEAWSFSMQVMGVYAEKKLVGQLTENDLPVITSNKIVFNNSNFSTEYINSKEGIRQNFIIQKEPDSKPRAIQLKLKTGKGWYINKVHDKELHFARRALGAKIPGSQLSKKITYNSLKVWDANKKELDAKFTVNKKHDGFEIEVSTIDVVYPITVDPLSTTANWTAESNQASAYFGNSVAPAGDVNGDGYSDVIVDAYQFSNGQANEGRAYVYHGSATGLSATPAWTAEGNQTGAQFGRGIASAGDVNGDGYSDIIVGCPYYSNGQSAEGGAFLYYGSASGLSASPAWSTESNQANALLGMSVAGAGDVNGDGYSDVIVGAPNYDNGQTDEGRAYVFYGSATGLPASPSWMAESNQAGAFFGGTDISFIGNGVAAAGDVNGDGYSDIIIGACYFTNGETNEGAAFAYMGSAAGLAASPAWTTESNTAFAYMANSLASAGDVNGDGYSDVIVGAHAYANGESYEGKVYIYFGSATGLSITPSWSVESNIAGHIFGCSVASAGDVNGDGYADVVIGGSVYNSGQGRSYVYLGSATGPALTAAWSVTGSANAYFGVTVSSAGDVNGDGYSDIIVGAFNDTNGQANEGRAFVYHGSASGVTNSPNAIFETNQTGNTMFSDHLNIASAGDVNGDGYSDIIIGAAAYDNGETDEGAVFIFHGSATGIVAAANPANANSIIQSNIAGLNLGYSVASAGDVNGDGYGDIIITARNYSNGESAEGGAFIYHGSASGIIASGNLSNANSKVESNQANALLGWSACSAGDVNADGYADIIVGDNNYNNGQSNEGIALVFHGSSTGIIANGNPSNANSFIESNNSNAGLGRCVAAAGDVNGDGFSDILIAAPFYSNSSPDPAGRVLIFHGSASGIVSLGTPANANANIWANAISGAALGVSVSGAGDVNGDGYSDVVIGAEVLFNGQNNEGGSYIYYGSSTGMISGTVSNANCRQESNQVSGRSGIVSSGGDLNGDGYSDIVVGTYGYSNVESGEGALYIYHGSATGFPAVMDQTTASAIVESNIAGAGMGWMVSPAGDVNGDGYSDILAGVPLYANGQASEGAAFIYYGNNNTGKRNNIRLYNTDLVTPIQRFNLLEPNLFGVGLYSRSPLGRAKGKLVWEVKQQGQPFSGNPITNSTAFLGKQPSFTDLGTAGVELKYNVQKQGRQNKIRARVEYDKVTAITGQVYGPWRYPPGYTEGAYGMSSIPLPVKLNSFTGALIAGKVKLQWISSDDEHVATYQVERSNDSRSFTVVGSVNSIHQNNSNYNFTDRQPLKGISWYRLKIIDGTGSITYSGIVQVKNDIDVAVFPTMINKGATVNLQFKNNITDAVNIRLVSSGGAIVFKKEVTSNGNNLAITFPSLPAGVYILSADKNGSNLITQKIMIR